VACLDGCWCPRDCWHCGYLRSTAGLILAVAEVATVLITTLTLLMVGLVVILRGSKEARDNLFRFLRWAPMLT
jgi:hypothetical protein